MENSNKNPSATKRGPGRFHVAGHKKATPPKQRGAGPGFVLHRASTAKRNRRALIKQSGGIRAFKRWERSVADLEAA